MFLRWIGYLYPRGATTETAVEDTAQRAMSTCGDEAGGTGVGKGWVTFSAAGGSQGHGVEETVAREWTRKGLEPRGAMCSASSKGIRLRCYEKKWLSWGMVPSQLCSEASCVDGAGQGSRQDLRRLGEQRGSSPHGGPRQPNPPVVATAARTLCPGIGSARLPGWPGPQRCLEKPTTGSTPGPHGEGSLPL